MFYINYVPWQPPHTTYPCGCCSVETKSSTTSAAAIMDSPGLETVHCWSNVRSRIDYIKELYKN